MERVKITFSTGICNIPYLTTFQINYTVETDEKGHKRHAVLETRFDSPAWHLTLGNVTTCMGRSDLEKHIQKTLAICLSPSMVETVWKAVSEEVEKLNKITDKCGYPIFTE